MTSNETVHAPTEVQQRVQMVPNNIRKETLPEMSGAKHFDLNIDKILDNWEVFHAVRELIANAIDESILTKTAVPTISKDGTGAWVIRDCGRGLQYQNLIQSENPEKTDNPSVIGKFGIGLKDALATFDRNNVTVRIRSKHGEIGLERVSKHSFEDIVTLHAKVAKASKANQLGTECVLHGLSDLDVSKAMSLFLLFSNCKQIDATKYGSVHKRHVNGGAIYINGMKVAEEPNFLFSYNITSLNASIKKSLNRERQNLGRTAYSDRIRSILLECSSCDVAQSLADDLQAHAHGRAHDELAWLDVQKHAVRILHAKKRVIFVSPGQIADSPEIIDSARTEGYEVIAIPTTLSDTIRGISDVQGVPITEINQFVKQQRESYKFTWITPESLTANERSVWAFKDRIIEMIGGRPTCVKEIRISETMVVDPQSRSESLGLWESDKGRIVIKRSELRSLSIFSGTLLHELLHAKYRVGDVSREFELRLTDLVGQLASSLLK